MIAILVVAVVSFLAGVVVARAIPGHRSRKARQRLERARSAAEARDRRDKDDSGDGPKLSGGGMIYMGGIGTH